MQDLTYEEILERIHNLQGRFGYLSTARDYGLDDASSRGKKCSANILWIRDSKAKALEQLPQILISGEIHGNERVGPHATLYTAELLIHSAQCAIEKKSSSCSFLESLNVSTLEMNWLAMLVMRREIIVVPTANCMGYILTKREDNGVDPNRDYSYSRTDNNCFIAHSSQLFLHLMAENMVQIVVTFHSGMLAIAYEWGSRNHAGYLHDKSPDDLANVDVATQMREFAGVLDNAKFPVGRMNSIVYPVDGGMEDWMYASGWDKQDNRFFPNCTGLHRHHNHTHNHLLHRHLRGRQQPRQLQTETTTETTTTTFTAPVLANENRAVVFLVEASGMKMTPDNTLGKPINMLNNTSEENNGHVPRNLRVALVGVDALQPYSCFSRTDFTHKQQQQQQHEHEHEQQHEHEMELVLEWYVGGSFVVDSSWLSLYDTSAFPANTFDSSDWTSYLQHIQPPFATTTTTGTGKNDFKGGWNVSEEVHGRTRWNCLQNERECKPQQPPTYQLSLHFRPTTTTTTASSSSSSSKRQEIVYNKEENIWLLPVGEYALVGWNTVDQHWGSIGQGNPTTLGPQSYFVQARTNSSYYNKAKNEQHVIQGRTHWPSDPLLLRVEKDGGMKLIHSVLHCASWQPFRPHVGSDNTGVVPPHLQSQRSGHGHNNNNNNNNNSETVNGHGRLLMSASLLLMVLAVLYFSFRRIRLSP